MHTSLKKALALGLESGGEGRWGATGIDLPNDGLSRWVILTRHEFPSHSYLCRFEQITYTEDDIALQMGFGTGFTPTVSFPPPPSAGDGS